MVAATFYSENVTNLTSDPISVLDRKKGRIKTIIDQRAVDASAEMNEANDMILFGPIPSNAVILDVRVMNDEIDSNACPTLEGDWGLVYSGIGGSQAEDGNTIGTEVDYNVFADASTVLQNAATSWASVRAATDDIVDVDKEAWEAGGLSADPGGLFYLSFRVGTAAATAADGDIVVRIDYI
jgi:hypothetical protein